MIVIIVVYAYIIILIILNSNIYIIIIYMIVVVYMIYVSMSSYVCLTKLIKDWSWSFCINCRYLCHYLTIVVSNIAIIFISCSCLLCWTYFLSTSSFCTISMIPIFTLICFIWWSTHIEKVWTTLLIIIDSTLF